MAYLKCHYPKYFYSNLLKGVIGSETKTQEYIKEIKKLGIDKVLITCRENNIGSKKAIENNGGIYENSYFDENNNYTYRRYWIEIK